MWNINNMSKKWLFNDINSDFQTCQIANVWPELKKKNNKNPRRHQTEVRVRSFSDAVEWMHDFSEWLLQRKKARRTKPEWGLLRERRSTRRRRGWSYTFLMPFADLWHASPVGQKENLASRLPPAALIQWKPAAWGSGGGGVLMCYSLFMMLENVCCSRQSTSNERKTPK